MILKNKIFIMGAARSGTTLLHKLIASHSNFCGINETELLKKIDLENINNEELINTISKSDEEKEIELKHFSKLKIKNAYKILDEYCIAQAKHFNAKSYVEKSPIHTFFISQILKNIPRAKIIVILRDPKSVVASRTNAPRISRGKAEGFPKFLQYYLNISETLFTFNYLDKLKIDKYRIKFVKYEDVVNEPEQTLKSIFKFINEEIEDVHENINPRDLRLKSRNIQTEMNSSFGSKNKNRVDNKNINNWKKGLTDTQIREIEVIFSHSKSKLLNTYYPEYNQKKGLFFKHFILNFLSYIDYKLFLIKNVKSRKKIFD